MRSIPKKKSQKKIIDLEFNYQLHNIKDLFILHFTFFATTLV